MGYLGSKKSKFYYQIIGDGPRTLLAFHGFGMDGNFFRPIPGYRIFAFDLPYHGKSEWEKRKKVLDRKWIHTHFTRFLMDEKINNFSLLGFSIGSKVVHSLLLEFPDRVKELIWIAPDGIYENFWYSFATSPAGRSIYRSLILDHPRVLRSLARLMRKLGFIPQTAYRIAQRQLGEPAKRKQTYHTWMILRRLSFAFASILEICNTYPFKTRVFLGSNDRIIDTNKVKSRLEKIHQADIRVIEANHFELLDKSLQLLSSEELKD